MNNDFPDPGFSDVFDDAEDGPLDPMQDPRLEASLRALRANLCRAPDEVTERRHLAAARAARRRMRRARHLRNATRSGVAAGLVLVALALTGTLPGPLQQTVADAATLVGITLPVPAHPEPASDDTDTGTDEGDHAPGGGDDGRSDPDEDVAEQTRPAAPAPTAPRPRGGTTKDAPDTGSIVPDGPSPDGGTDVPDGPGPGDLGNPLAPPERVPPPPEIPVPSPPRVEKPVEERGGPAAASSASRPPAQGPEPAQNRPQNPGPDVRAQGGVPEATTPRAEDLPAERAHEGAASEAGPEANPEAAPPAGPQAATEAAPAGTPPPADDSRTRAEEGRQGPATPGDQAPGGR